MATIIKNCAKLSALCRNQAALVASARPLISCRSLSIASAKVGRHILRNDDKREAAVGGRLQWSNVRCFGSLGPPKKIVDLKDIEQRVVKVCGAYDKVDAGKVSCISAKVV